MKDDIQKVISAVRVQERALSEASTAFRNSNKQAADRHLLEEQLFYPCQPEPFSKRLAAVDGGIVSEEYQACELVLYRAVCSVFEYSDGKVVKKASHPTGLDGFESLLLDAFDDSDNSQRDSILRLAAEIARARESIGLFSPDMIFLDGSIFPNPQDRPPKESAAAYEFERLLEDYRALFSDCAKAGITLVGVVKDSKSRTFLDGLRKSGSFLQFYSEHAKCLSRTNDSAFLSMALQENERSGLAKIERPDLGAGLCSTTPATTYLKAVKYDRPLRLEFSDYTRADEACKAICGLCKGNSRYAYPSILIEADLRAAMDPAELEVAYARLCAKIGPDAVSIRRLRRNERPFR